MALVLIYNHDKADDPEATPGENLSSKYKLGMVVAVLRDDVTPGTEETAANGFWWVRVPGPVEDWVWLREAQRCLKSEVDPDYDNDDAPEFWPVVRRRRRRLRTEGIPSAIVTRLNNNEIVEINVAAVNNLSEEYPQPIRESPSLALAATEARLVKALAGTG